VEVASRLGDAVRRGARTPEDSLEAFRRQQSEDDD
jgi:hypothetical protein